MATSGSGRGPIKVGSGYIDVYPKLNQEQLRKTKAELEKQMGATGKTAGKAFSEGITAQIATIPKKAKEASEKAQKEIQKGAKDSKKVLKKIEQEITAQYGEEAGKRFREAAELEKKKQKLLDDTSASTRRALSSTVKQEEEAARTTARSWETAEKQRIQFIRDREKAAEQAAKAEAAAERRAQQQIRDDLRRTLTQARQARVQDLQSQMDAQRDQATALRNQLRDYRRQMDDHVRTVGRGLSGLQSSWKHQGEAIEALGTNVTETGRLVSTYLLAPLGAVAATLSTIGVKSADMRILGQMGLSAAGVSQNTSASEMRKIQQYAIATPFSIDTMHEYQMKLIRSIAGNDKQWYNPKTKTKAANRAASKTSDIIMSVGDTMARAGNLDPAMFDRAMYAVDRIMDMNKAPTRNINQLVQATGIPAGELAQMFGFSSAGAFWKQVGTPVAKGGGISGQDMIDNLLRFWDPKYFVMDKKTGKPKIDPKTKLPIVNTAEHSTAGGSKGYGERMTAATITGRIQQVKEQAQFSLGSLFAKENPKTHQYEYTSLGQSIMGKASGKDKNGNTIYKGGLLNQIQKLGSDQKGNIITLLKTFFDSLSTFVKQIQWFSDWLNSHPKVKEVFASLLKMAAVAMPFVLAVGLATKTFGKMTKIISGALTPLKGAFKGIRGATRVGRQVAAGIGSRRNGGSFSEGYTNRRTELRGGDTRGPIARTRDRVTGNNPTLDGLRGQIRDTEDAIRDTEDRITGLQRQLRDVNRVSISQLVNQFAGSGAGSAGHGNLQGSARTASTAVNNTQTQVQQLNRQNLNDVSKEFDNLKEKVDDLTKKVKDSETAVNKLDQQKLTTLKVTIDTTHGVVIDLKDKLDNTASSVRNLDQKKLGDLRTKQIETTKVQADRLKTEISHAATEVSKLNTKKLTAVRKQISDTTSAANKLWGKLKDVISRITTLNGKKLTSIRGQFHGDKNSLYNAANDVYKLVGTSKSGLNGRIYDLNRRSLATITKAMKSLGDAVKDTSGKAGTLNDRLESISRHAPGGSSGGSSKKKRRKKAATGAILPGYTPGRDVHTFVSPTAGTLELSGGEAVMRPEFTAALGPQNVNRLNQIARTQGIQGIKKSMKFAGGGVLGKLGLNSLVDASKNFDIFSDALGSFATMAMDSSSRRLGGDAQSGTVGSGTDGSHFVGSDIANKFEGMYKFFTNDSWKILKKLPIPDGYSQIIGILGGALTPLAGQYFWDDVWKGKGNILQRGGAYLNDMFSWKTLKGVVGNLFGGVWDTVKSLFSGGKALVTDPVGTVKDSITGLWDLGKSEFDGMIDMVKTLGTITTSPMDYAKQVWGDTYSTAKDALPNTKGLFDFSGNHLTAKKPDIDALVDGEVSAPGAGTAVTRWTKQVRMALGELGLPLSATDLVLHRIQVESGGNPIAINLTDSNAKAGYPSQGLMQTIPQTFAAYAGPYVSRGISDPMANIYAGLNYAVHRYGSGWMKALSGNKGYWTGTLSASPGLAMVGEKGPELVDFGRGGARVYSNRQSADMVSGGGRPVQITVNEAKHETTPQAILRGFQWIDSMYGNRL